MTIRKLQGISIKGLSAAVPKNIVPVPDTKRRFKKLTGIQERRICPPEMFVSHLAKAASDKLLDDLKWSRDSINSLIVVTQTPDMEVPATACILQSQLGLSQECAAFDVSMGCSAYPYGLQIANGFLSKETPRALLIVGDGTGKVKEHIYEPLFGDAVSVTALEYNPEAYMYCELFTNGDKWDVICERSVDGNPPAELKIVDGQAVVDRHYTLKGEDVYHFAIKEAPAAIRRMIDYCGADLSEMDGVILHQANKIINDTIQKRLALTDEQVPSTLSHFGNTSSATVPLTLLRGFGDRLKNEPLYFILCGFGVGLSWGAVYTKIGPIVCPKLVEI